MFISTWLAYIWWLFPMCGGDRFYSLQSNWEWCCNTDWFYSCLVIWWIFLYCDVFCFPSEPFTSGNLNNICSGNEQLYILDVAFMWVNCLLCQDAHSHPADRKVDFLGWFLGSYLCSELERDSDRSQKRDILKMQLKQNRNCNQKINGSVLPVTTRAN